MTVNVTYERGLGGFTFSNQQVEELRQVYETQLNLYKRDCYRVCPLGRNASVSPISTLPPLVNSAA